MGFGVYYFGFQRQKGHMDTKTGPLISHYENKAVKVQSAQTLQLRVMTLV